MAMRGPAHISGDSKECAQCGAIIIRKKNQNGTNWTGRRHCSVQCSNAAKIKVGPPQDIIGQTFGRWTVAAYHGRVRGRHHAWDCICACGNKGTIEGGTLKSGGSKSCGCLQREATAKAGRDSATHGMSKSAPEYYVWCSLKQRCLNPKTKNWSSYGGRGITVCDRWRDSFEAFYADMGPRPTADHSIDRIDNDGNYEPGNCRWEARDRQVRNRRSNIIVTYRGEAMALVDAAALAGVKYSTARARLKRGLTAAEALRP